MRITYENADKTLAPKIRLKAGRKAETVVSATEFKAFRKVAEALDIDVVPA